IPRPCPQPCPWTMKTRDAPADAGAGSCAATMIATASDEITMNRRISLPRDGLDPSRARLKEKSESRPGKGCLSSDVKFQQSARGLLDSTAARGPLAQRVEHRTFNPRRYAKRRTTTHTRVCVWP